MTSHFLVPSFLFAVLAFAQIEIPAEFTQPKATRVQALKTRAAAAQPGPLWISLAGKRVLGNRAHVIMPLADPARPPAGVRVLEPWGDGLYLVGLDLTSSLGVEMLAGRAATAPAQVLEDADKLGAALLAKDPTLASLPRAVSDEANGQTVRSEVIVCYHADVDPELVREDLRRLGVNILEDSPYFRHFEVRLSPTQLRELVKADWVQFLEPSPAPARTLDNAISARLIGDDKLQADPYSLTGREVNLGIIDGGSVAAHTEFGDRLTLVDRGTSSAHATHVAGTMIAAGNDPKLKGMAPAARLFSWSYSGSVQTKVERGATDQQVSVFNNSWGEVYSIAGETCGLYGTYGTRERDLDKLVREKNLSLVFAAGNDRDWTDCTIPPRGGFYTIGRPATSKNIISVGAVDQTLAVADFSSAGPMRDRRIKPDIVAMGVNVVSTYLTSRSQVLSGTSMAAPAISGTAGLLVERYRSQNGGASPSPALVKAALLNTAKDLGNIGPDYVYGYGLADAPAAVKVLDDRTYVADRLSGGETRRHTINVPANAPSLRVMLAYSDADAVLTASSVITNHLELVLTGPDGATRKLPLRLDPANPTATAVEREGDRDNVKQVVVANPASGAWTAEVRGADVPLNAQEYVVVWTVAENPVPPCRLTLSPTTQVISEQAGYALLTVTTGNHCDRWAPQDLPSWAKLLGPATRQGTDLARLSISPNDGDGPRSARIRVGDQSIKVVQNYRCKPQVISPGQTISSDLSVNDCYYESTFNAFAKLFTFEAKQGQSVNIVLQSTDVDTYLLLLAPNGEIYDLDDDGFDVFGTNSRLPALSGNLQLPVAGKYTIVATTYDPDEVGNFSVRLEFADVTGLAPVAPQQLSGCPAEATGTLTDGSPRVGRRGDLHPTEIFQFPGRIGQQVTIEVSSSEIDPFVYLIGPGGAAVGTATDLDGTGKARLTAILKESGPFGIEVSSFSPFTRGAFSLRLDGCTRP